MRIAAIILAIALGGFMLFNGIFELLTDTFFGMEYIPRPWMGIVDSIGINPYTLCPIFLLLGFTWIYFAYLLWQKHRNAYLFGTLASIFSLWYLPFGTIIAVAIIALLQSNRKPSGLLR